MAAILCIWIISNSRLSNAHGTLYSGEPSGKRVVTATSTTSYAAVDGVTGVPDIRVLIVMNYTDGDLYVQFGTTTGEPRLIIKQNTDLIIDNDAFRGQMYIKNATGTGGTVYVKAW